MEEEAQKDTINDLPHELLVKILGYLPRYDLVSSASLVCKKWHQAAFDQDNWKKLEVCIGDKITIKDLSRLVQKSTKILCLNLDETLLDETFLSVLENCTTLDTLELSSVVTSASLSSRIALTAIGHHCEKLQKLTLYHINGMTDEILISILRSCKYLKILEIIHCKNLSNSVLSVIGEHGSQLKEVITMLLGNRHLDGSVKALVDGCRHLESLRMFSNFSDCTDLKCLADLKSLKVFAVHCKNYDNDKIDDTTIIHWLSGCRNLHHFGVSSRFMTDKTLEQMSVRNLVNIEIFISSEVTDQGLEHLAKCKTLEKILMTVNRDSGAVTAGGIINFVKNLRKLKKIMLMVVDSNVSLIRQMNEISSVWKGVYPILVKNMRD